MYRPKFCAECGGKILRLHWRVWTSHKFCEVCSPVFVKAEMGRAVIVSAALFVIGLAFGHASLSAPPPLLVERHQDAQVSTLRKPGVVDATTQNDNSGVAAAGNSANSPPSAAEVVYLCGARTKKGTPCTRRVHGPVRCWQHKGMPAMHPPEKLRVPD
jgi:hypothetical protein